MSVSRTLVKRLPAVALIGLAGVLGCHHNKTEVSGPETKGPYKVEVEPSDVVELSEPVVSQDRDKITVAGIVHRKDSGSEDVAGRVDIEILGPDGLSLYPNAPWTGALDPKNVPVGAAGSHYAPNLGIVPPDGSTIRVRFVSRAEARREDLKNSDPNYTGSGGHIDEGETRSKSTGSGTTGAKSY